MGEAARSAAAHAAVIKSRPEPSIVVHVAFGDWPVPVVDHPDSITIKEFVSKLEAAGHSKSLADGRRTLASWIDKKTSLRTLRLTAGLSQDELATLMGTSQPQIARLESGRQDIQLSTMKRLADVLKITLHQIVDAANG